MSTVTQATSTRSQEFRDYSRDDSRPTAVAIDRAIRRVLEERHRAKIEKQDSDASASPQPTDSSKSLYAPVEAINESSKKAASSAPKRHFHLPKPVSTIVRNMRSAIDRAVSVIGPASTFERGFIVTAGAIVVILTILHLVGQTSPLYGIGVSGLIFAGSLAPALRRGIGLKQVGQGLAWPAARRALTCIICAPIFVWLAGSSMGRTRKAAICTSWAGMLAGTAALIASM